MNRSLVILTCCALSGVLYAAKPAASEPQPTPVEVALTAIEAGNLNKAEKQLSAIESPAGKLYVQASVERAKGEQAKAIKTLSKLVVNYPNDADWIAKADYMCAEVYCDLGMSKAADVTAKQVEALYPGTELAQKAEVLRAKIENDVEKKAKGQKQD